MNFPGYINLFGSSLSLSQKIYSLDEFVKEVVNDEIETCRLTKSKVLLLQIKDPLIKYLTTEYYKVPNEKFVDYVCELVNLDQILVPTFTKAFFALESIATKMEECRNVIRSQKDQIQLDKDYEEYVKRRLQKEPTKEKSPEPQPRTNTNGVRHDPRPNPYKYSPPKSIFDPKEPAVFKSRNGSTSNVQNLGASNGIPQKDITMDYVADEQPPPVTDLSPPMVSPPRLPFQPPQNGSRARSPSYYRDRIASNNASFNSTTTATYPNTKSGGPADLSSSSRSYVPPTPYEKRTQPMLDAESEEEEEEQRQPVNKKKRVGFHDSTRDNEGAARGKYLDNATVTLATPLSEHVAVDHKLVLEIDSCSNTMAAFPNQPLPITTPSRIVYENWQRNVTNQNMDEEFQEDVIETLQQFRYNNRNKGQKPNLHLVIKDSLLFPTKFQKKYRQCLEIDAKYPQRMEVIIDAMENEISQKKNDYFIKNVIFSMGFDLLCYEPNIENAIKNLLYFLRKFVEVLRAAFDHSGPKRFKSITRDSTDSIPIQIPKLIVLTIPFIDSHLSATTFKHQITTMNEALRKYVKENKEKLFIDFNQIIEIYDWEEKAHGHGKCNRADLESRFKVLTTALSENHQMFMVEQKPNSHGFGQNDSNGYDSQDYDSDELQG